MEIPKQVQAQLEEAERIERELLGGEPLVEELPAEPPTPEPPEPAAEVPAPAVEPVEPAPVVEAPTPPSPEESTWEHRFKSLQGKYNAEVPRLHAELKDLKTQLTQLIERKPEAPPQPEKPLVDEKDIETFGSDLIDVIDRKAREVAGKMVGTEMAELRAENQKLREQIDGVSERQVSNNRQTFFADLARDVPDWEAVNIDERFLSWLSEVDPLSGQPRQAYLTSAYESFDAGRTAALFNTFKQMTAPPAPPVAAAPPKDLERQIAPGTSKVSTAAPTNTNEKVWSTKEIDQFYARVRRGELKADEASRIEAEIDLAVASGRVRP